MPLFILIPLLALMVAGTGLTAYGMYAQGQAQSASAKYQSQVERRQAQEAKIQAQWAEANAQIAKGEAELKASRQKERMRRLIGEQRAAAGKSGVTGKTLLDVELETAGKALADLELIKWGGDVEYLATMFQGQGLRGQSDVLLASSKYRKQEAGAYSVLGGVSASASLLKGMSETGFMAYEGLNSKKK